MGSASLDEAPYPTLLVFGQVLILQLYLLSLAENGPKSGPEGPGNSRFFRGLKPPARSGKGDLQL
jgi:hypothetical protein